MDNSARRVKELKSSTSNGTQSPLKNPKSKHATGSKSKPASQVKSKDADVEADDLTLWQHPFITLDYFLRELLIDCLSLGKKILRHKLAVLSTILIVVLFFVLGRVSGPQQEVIASTSFIFLSVNT